MMTTLAACILLLGATALTAGEAGPAIETEAAASLDAPVEQSPQDKFAVVIGIVYPNYDLGVIKYADRDAGAVYDLLTRKMGFPPGNVLLLQNAEATRENMLEALHWLADNAGTGSGSEVVFFYSGHGLRNGPGIGLNVPAAGGAYALVPYDYGNFDYKKGQGLLWDQEIISYLSRIEPESMWIGIDSCYSGGFSQPGITGTNRVVTLSSQADQLSSEIDLTQRGVMTQLLVEEGLKQGATVEEAFWFTSNRAAPEFGQNPQISDGYAGSLIFSGAE